MEYILTGRQPAHIMRFFEEISAIPHCSGNEKAVSDYVVAFAKSHGLKAIQDDLFNVIVHKPGSAGCEDMPAVILQGHLDMVGEKTELSAHDFDTDPISLLVEGDTLRADGTTLGADNGIAVAYMLAALEDETLIHPPLECVFTVQEETGLIGAGHLDVSSLTGRMLINMDSGPEGYLFSTCAGGLKASIEGKLSRQAFAGIPFSITVRGLRGGHSGIEIGSQRGNACKLLSRVLCHLRDRFDVCLVAVGGGGKDNVIPSLCGAVVALQEGDLKAVESETAAIADIIKNELEFLEPGVEFAFEPAEIADSMLTRVETNRLIDLMLSLPTGVRGMSTAIEGLVSLSVNFASIYTEEDSFKICMSLRSNQDSQKEALFQEISAIVRAFGANCLRGSEYPGWSHALHSPLRDRCQAIYKKMYGKEFVIKGTHGGLECGVLGAKLPGVDIVAIGPDSADYHSVKETLDLNSFARVWDFLAELLEDLSCRE